MKQSSLFRMLAQFRRQAWFARLLSVKLRPRASAVSDEAAYLRGGPRYIAAGKDERDFARLKMDQRGARLPVEADVEHGSRDGFALDKLQGAAYRGAGPMTSYPASSSTVRCSSATSHSSSTTNMPGLVTLILPSIERDREMHSRAAGV